MNECGRRWFQMGTTPQNASPSGKSHFDPGDRPNLISLTHRWSSLIIWQENRRTGRCQAGKIGDLDDRATRRRGTHPRSTHPRALVLNPHLMGQRCLVHGQTGCVK